VTEPVAVDTEMMGKAAGNLDQLTTTLRDLHERLDSRLRAEGQCWGTDEIGQAFAEEYLPAATKLLELAPAINKVLLSMRSRLNVTIGGYELADQASGDIASQLNNQIATGTGTGPAGIANPTGKRG
jgi:hypothetical protein